MDSSGVTNPDISQPFRSLLLTLTDLLSGYMTAHRLDPVPVSLSEAADQLIDGYILRGIDPDLTGAEIDQGVLDCDTALNILKDQNAELDLTLAEIQSLDQTISSMREDLTHEP